MLLSELSKEIEKAKEQYGDVRIHNENCKELNIKFNMDSYHGRLVMDDVYDNKD